MILNIIISLILILIACGVYFYIANTVNGTIGIIAYLDGEKIGYIDSSKTIESALTELTDTIYAEAGVVYRFDGKLSYKLENIADGADCVSRKELYELFSARCSDDFAEAYALQIDDNFIAACEKEEDIRSVLKKIESDETGYTGLGSALSAVISNKIVIEKRLCPTGDVISSDRLYGMLAQKKDSTTETAMTMAAPAAADKHAEPKNRNTESGRDIIRSGNTPESINFDIDYGIPRNGIKPENEDIKLAFRYVGYETVTETAEYKTEYRYNGNLYQDYYHVLQEGREGTEELTYELQYEGTELISRRVVARKIIDPPSDAVVLRGTKEYPEPGVIVDDYIWPMLFYEEPVITSYFGENRPEYDGTEYHFGIDIYTPVGTGIFASNGGVVSYVNETRSYGIMIIIDHNNGIQTCYPHLSEVFVDVGDKVYQGQNIALSGNTGVTTAPHLHFEVRVNNVPKDPLDFLHDKPWTWVE